MPRSPANVRPAPLLALYREQAGLSQLAVARRGAFHHSGINRAERAERGNSRDMLLRYAAALELEPPQADHLLAAAGYCPEWVHDVTIRQVVFLLRSLPPNRERSLRRAIDGLTKKVCKSR